MNVIVETNELDAVLTEYRRPTVDARINEFPIRCFRDTGDGDYIMARLAMRARLDLQFLWAAEQAVEKYLKCILVLNRVNTRKISHDLKLALDLTRECLGIELALTSREQDIFDCLVKWNADRYLIKPYHLEGKVLMGLDLLVWRLRQYCTPLDVEHVADKPSKDLLKRNLKIIESRSVETPKLGFLEGGLLEKILEDASHPSRPGLVWRNLRFSTSNRKAVLGLPHWRSVNSPLYLAQEREDAAVIARVEQLMKLN